ncbi:phosphodiester glycosidase family protein [Ruminiclostridium herbifermentans]|uniref:Phosphodiester glycosidase family protein n=1 Tax=Ruminiclostridium herbifermentans TaxID=2488810 RepID=A0A4U7JJH6_9FIRM|nr:phosphodiester glycosidase family protein [Ruminiclostridium herbifermentans]QNU67425.1 phosphodiester glycosidase family protein [Ruminiclostridium herbifermentans]
MRKNNHNLIIVISIFVILSCILFYAGQFLFYTENTKSPITQTAETTEIEALRPVPIEYKNITTSINGKKQEIFLIEFDPLDNRVEFKPVLSYNNVFGFENLSEICKRTGAYAAINAGFFYENGDPVGMVAIDSELVINATGRDPVLLIDKNGVRFEKLFTQLSFSVNGEKIYINKLNRSGLDGNIVLYTNVYGSTNRARIKNTSVSIKNGTVTSIIRDTLQEVPIQKDSSLLSFFGKNSELPDKLGIKVGDKINIEMEPKFTEPYEAYECGCMLVDNGISVVPDEYRWVGSLNNQDPRTAIGIKEDGRVVLFVVDGRQPGYSSGLTGKELAEYLVSIGVKHAAMLDGGATSQMFVDGELKNKPSYRGIERPVAGAFIVKVKN